MVPPKYQLPTYYTCIKQLILQDKSFSKFSMSGSLVFSWFRVNTDRKNRIILCYIPDNCAIVLFCFVSIILIFGNEHFSSFENSTKFKIEMSQLIVQIYKLSRAASRTVWHPRVVRGAMHSRNKWRCAVWLNAMHSGKKWWIGEFVLPSIYSSYILFMFDRRLFRYLGSFEISRAGIYPKQPKEPCCFLFIPQGKEISHFTYLA